MKLRTVLAAISGIGALTLWLPAFAQCTVPNVLTNGQVADASEVMDNFNAVAECADQAVIPTGTPQTGQVAVFSGSQTVTGGDLTGDVTTSGSTAATLATTGVNPGSYINPNITVDSKGRITEASNGTGSGGGTTGWTELTLTNPGAETGNTTGWTMANGGFTATIANPSGHTMTPILGSYAFTATANADPQMSQTIDLSTFATEIDAGTVSAMLEAYSAETYNPGESPYMFLDFRDASNVRRSLAITPDSIRSLGAGTWRGLSVVGRVPPGTRSMRIVLWAKRVDGTNNNLAFDGVRVFLTGF